MPKEANIKFSSYKRTGEGGRIECGLSACGPASELVIVRNSLEVLLLWRRLTDVKRPENSTLNAVLSRTDAALAAVSDGSERGAQSEEAVAVEYPFHEGDLVLDALDTAKELSRLCALLADPEMIVAVAGASRAIARFS